MQNREQIPAVIQLMRLAQAVDLNAVGLPLRVKLIEHRVLGVRG